MERKGKKGADEVFLRRLGKQIEQLIADNDYRSAYDFWKRKASPHLSRQTLHYILGGKMDPKITTLKSIAQLLGSDLSGLFSFASKPARKKKARARVR